MYAACGCCLLLQMRIKFENMLLWGLIDGPKKPKNLQLHFHRLVDELEVVWNGVRMWDANKGSGTRNASLCCWSSKTTVPSEMLPACTMQVGGRRPGGPAAG